VRAGVATARVKAEGFGSQHPLAPNTTEAGRAQNRRIALLVTKR
jgi:outer membrane protein OmpA-like peptidoglycan-associated protein